jgi:phosphoglycolate phosphatase
MRCVVFDFDGTLVLSNDIKRDGFIRAAEQYAGGGAIMRGILENPPGDRVAIFARFTEVLGIERDADALVAEYTRWCEQEISRCAQRPGAKALLTVLHASGVASYVNSATPIEPLRHAVEAHFPDTFAGIHGGHGRKVANLEAIARSAAATPADMAMVGDGVDDREAAQRFGCRFVAIAGGTLARAGVDGLIDDLTVAIPALTTNGATRSFHG